MCGKIFLNTGIFGTFGPVAKAHGSSGDGCRATAIALVLSQFTFHPVRTSHVQKKTLRMNNHLLIHFLFQLKDNVLS
jgi:hypothetical protein